MTLPKDPVPKVLILSKSSRPAVFCKHSTNNQNTCNNIRGFYTFQASDNSFHGPLKFKWLAHLLIPLTYHFEIVPNSKKLQDKWNVAVNPLPHMPILGSSNPAANKDICKKYGQIETQFSDWVEKIVGKEEIACNKQFLLFPHCFSKLSVADVSKWV